MKKLLTLIFLCASLALQAAPVEILDDLKPVEQKRYRGLISELRCLVCQNQSLAESDAELAVDMRKEVHKKIAAGESDQEIVDFLVARYGDFVRYRPPVNATTLLLWFGPFALLALGAVFLIKNSKQKDSPKSLTSEQHTEAQRLLKESDKDHTS